MIELPCVGESLLSLIPQRAPIIMVDKFRGLEDDISLSNLTILDDNIFIEGQSFTESGLIEHIAQSAAARIGYIYKLKNEEVPIGYIGSVDKLTIRSFPKVGDILDTQIRVLQEIFGLTLIYAEVYIGTTLIASCNMKIFLGDEKK
ncbi:hypothetical protein [Bacteroides propionicifaciens]|uniref:hypothetical protein n=1 Tax=Bacteroides propionicifaciens TaxID=392838 RepID=UPI000382C197|nr:hypothetical protein [Bacteroides propionicifaciens]